MTDKGKVLEDHRRVGKKFIPPFIDGLGDVLQETSWIKEGIPEFLWISLLINKFGYVKGVDLVLALVKETKEISKKNECYAITSMYISLSEEEKNKIVEALKQKEKYDAIAEALTPMNALYSAFPIKFIKPVVRISKEEALSLLKTATRVLYDKYSREAVMVQATVIYTEFVTGRLMAFRGSSFENFPEVENYPQSEESKQIAAFVRASINGLLGVNDNPALDRWKDYFWNHGIEIDSCEGIL